MITNDNIISIVKFWIENSMIKHNLYGPLVQLIVDVQTSFFLPRCQIFCHCYIFLNLQNKNLLIWHSIKIFKNGIFGLKLQFCISMWDLYLFLRYDMHKCQMFIWFLVIYLIATVFLPSLNFSFFSELSTD